MKISIIIPIYNVESYVAHCIQSVMDQTYEGSIECLLVDDCGNDNSMGIVEDMLGDYEGPIEFKVLHHEHNRGLSAARNSGTEEASGDYVFFLDSDDAISVDCIALMVEVVSNHPEVEVVQGATESIPYKKYYDLELCKTPRFVDDNDWVRYNAYKYGERLPVNATNKLLKKSFLTGNALTFKEGITNEDELWSFILYERVRYWAVIVDTTYLHYIRSSSIMGTLNDQNRASNMGIVVSEALKTVDNPFRDLQVYRCMNSFVKYVYPYATDRDMVKRLSVRLLVSLLRIGKFNLAFWFAVGFFNKPRRRKLLYETMPQVYKETSERYSALFCNAHE